MGFNSGFKGLIPRLRLSGARPSLSPTCYNGVYRNKFIFTPMYADSSFYPAKNSVQVHQTAPIYCCTHLLLHPSTAIHIYCCTHLLLYTSTAAHIYCCTHLLLHTSTAAPIYCCTHLLLHTSTAAPIYCCTHLLLHPSTAAPIYCYTHLLLHPSTAVHIYCCTHLLLYTSTAAHEDNPSLLKTTARQAPIVCEGKMLRLQTLRRHSYRWAGPKLLVTNCKLQTANCKLKSNCFVL